MFRLQLEAMGGFYFNQAVKQAKDLAKKLDVEVSFDFNGLPIVVRKDSVIIDVVRDYDFRNAR